MFFGGGGPSPTSHVDLAYRQFSQLSPKLLDSLSPSVTHLDLSHNELGACLDLSALERFPMLQVLVIDGNQLTHQTVLPYLPQLHSLSANKNAISNLLVFVKEGNVGNGLQTRTGLLAATDRPKSTAIHFGPTLRRRL